MAEMKTLNGYEIVDAKAREDIETLKSGSGGGGITPFVFNATNTSDMTDEEKEMAVYIFNYYKTNKALPKDYLIYFKYQTAYYLATGIQAPYSNSIRLDSNPYTTESDAGSILQCRCQINVNGEEVTGYSPSLSFLYQKEAEWKYDQDGTSSELYGAKEILILGLKTLNNENATISSHVVIPQGNTLGQFTHIKWAFNTPYGMDNQTPYWQYNGSSIDLHNKGDFNLEYVYYKI